MNYDIGEIVTMYKQAADKNKQIEILAQLNCCSKEEIYNILAEKGCISGVKPKKTDKRISERGKWTSERLEELQRFIDEGFTYAEIGERMGEGKQSIADAVSKYNLKGRGQKKKASEAEDKPQATQVKEDKLPEEQRRQLIHMSNELDDIGAAAKIIKDMIFLLTMVSAEELEDYESTVQTMLISVMQQLDEIIRRCEKF